MVAMLHDAVKDGVHSIVSIDGENGVAKGLEKLNKLKRNV